MSRIAVLTPKRQIEVVGPKGRTRETLDDMVAEHQSEAEKLSRKGLKILAFGLLPIMAWIALAPLSSAVVASAFVKVDLNRRQVQHREGGIVREVRVRDGQQLVTDGPFAETREHLGGYYVIDVKDLDEAIEWAAKLPASGSSVEIRPVVVFE